MASFNRVVLVGNVTRDPELRYISTGLAVTDVGLAVNDRRKDQNGSWIDETTFVDITLWGKTAEIAAEYAKKGTQILIEGRLKMDSWESDGQKRSKLKIVGERLVLLGSRQSGGGDGGSYSSGSNRGGSNSGYNNAGYGGGNNNANAGGGSYSGGYGGAPSYDDGPGPSAGDDIPF